MIGRRGVACLLAGLALGCDAQSPQTAEEPGAPRAADHTRAAGASASGDGAPSADAGSSAELMREPAEVEGFTDTAVKTPAEYLLEPRFAQADIGRGELLSYACRACHALDYDERNPLGPNLAGVFGRRAGTTDFEYSDALQTADLIWTPAALDAWLARPESFIPGNNMAFTGYRSAVDRRDLIAYLLRETGF